MSVILQTWCQTQPTSSSLRYVNCGPEIYNAITAPPIQASIYKWKYLLWYWIYIDNSMCVIWHTWCQHSAHQSVYAAWTVVPDIYNVVTSPHVQSSVFNWTSLRSNWRHLYNSMRVIVQTWSQIQLTSSRLRYVNCGPGHIQWNDNTAYSGFNIQLNVSKLLLKTSGKFKERHTSNIVPHTTHIIQFTLCEPVVSTIYNVVTVTYIHASIFKWTCLRCYWRYSDISMRVMLQIWCQIQPTSSSLRYVNCGHEIYNAITVPHIHASIFKWKYLLWYWRYIDNSICVILQTWCQIQRTSYS
jgi:hypothetical protein